MDLQSALGTANQVLKNAFKSVSDEVQMCIQNCTTCHQICEQTISHCLEKGGVHAAPAHIRLLSDCAEICAVSANFMMRGSALHSTVCAACAEVCMACADSCEQMGSSDEMMKACADVCRQCAESCRKMGARH
ncbi:MAG: four-helix bundle copper-binding protein [Bdellovibrionales bacterium]